MSLRPQQHTHTRNTHMKRDVYQEVTDKLVAAIEAAQASGSQWKMPWRKLGQMAERPTNAVTKRPYRGINTALLWMADGFADPRWATFKQWQSVGASVRKGERGTLIVFYKPLKITDGDTGAEKTIPLLRSSYVFNISQVDNVPERMLAKAEPPVDTTAQLAAVDAAVAATGADIRHGGDAAFYVPSKDFIQMPHRHQFTGDTQTATAAYYSTLLHELVHWTGHVSRLDRMKGGGFGSEGYAFEELVAELGAAFLCSELGVSNEPRDDHAKYLASWLKVLKGDRKAIFKAASLAEKAADLIKGNAVQAEETEAEPEAVAA